MIRFSVCFSIVFFASICGCVYAPGPSATHHASRDIALLKAQKAGPQNADIKTDTKAALRLISISTIPADEAEGIVGDVYNRSRHDFHMVYNYLKALSLRPEVMAAVDSQYRTLMLGHSGLDQKERAFIIAVISRRNGDASFAQLHWALARSMAGGASVDFETGEYKGKNLPARAEAILDFAVKAHDAPATVSDADISTLRGHGLTDQGILDITALTALTRFINTTSLALGATPEPQNIGEGIVRGRSYDIPFHRGDSHYDAILAASDGKYYFAVCSHHIDTHAQFFSFDPATKQVAHIADIGEVVGEKDAGAIPQGKVHSYLFEHEGKIWFTTFKGYYRDDLQGRKPYPGGHFVSYDLKSGKFQAHAMTPDGEGIPTCALDRVNGILYGITYPAGRFFAYHLKTGELEEIVGETFSYGCRPTVDPAGYLYLNRQGGGLLRYDPRRPKGERMTQLPIDTEKASYGPAAPGAAIEIFWDSVRDDGMIYAMHFGTSSISIFDLEAMEFIPLARMSAGEKRKALVNFRGSSPGCPRSPEGVFYHLTVGPPFTDPPKQDMRYNIYLTSYDPAINKSRNHGPVYFEDDRRLLYNAAGMLSPDGKTFVSIGWVEVNDPARIDEVQALRNESSPPETSRRVYELRVIEIPIPGK